MLNIIFGELSKEELLPLLISGNKKLREEAKVYAGGRKWIA